MVCSTDSTFLLAARRHLTMNIYSTCYCTVHVYVVIHLCGSVFFFYSKSESVQGFLYHLFTYVLPVDSVIKNNLATFFACPKPEPRIPMSYVMVFFVFSKLR